MRIEEIEAEALKLDPKERAKLAEKLLESLEQLSDEENARLWAEEAERRDREWDANADSLPVTEAQRKELDRRLAEHQKDPRAGRRWSAVRDSLARKK